MSTKQFSDLVDQRAKAYAEIHDCSYLEAFHKVLDDNPPLKAALITGVKAKTPDKGSPSVSSYSQKQAGDKINELVVTLMAEQEGLCSYAEALKIVLANHPNLARQYNG